MLHANDNILIQMNIRLHVLALEVYATMRKLFNREALEKSLYHSNVKVHTEYVSLKNGNIHIVTTTVLCLLDMLRKFLIFLIV